MDDGWEIKKARSRVISAGNSSSSGSCNDVRASDRAWRCAINYKIFSQHVTFPEPRRMYEEAQERKTGLAVSVVFNGNSTVSARTGTLMKIQLLLLKCVFIRRKNHRLLLLKLKL